MIKSNQIQKMLLDLESDRIERTISTTNTDKFGQAICAFANDLPENNKPGYLIIGAEDDGKVHPIHVTDELLKNVAAIRTDGNIQPQPSMTVQKVKMDEGEMIVVEVHPSTLPPVKYKGKIWVRIGPRKNIANEDDEKRLYEKRASGISTFDAMPCVNATTDDLDIRLFKQFYLPQSIPEDILDEDSRSVEMQLQALGFYDNRHSCPTNAGILFFGKNIERFFPGAYIQYVKFNGADRAAEIASEYKFSGNLCSVLSKLDTFVDTSITNRRPIPVSALREKIVIDYPHWATRELLMNAICHRTYESHGPIQFYQYTDRIEIMNPGGLYGKVNAQNFPYVNDYRNPVIAEGMKVLGYVNRFSRGVMRVEKELEENGNGEPEFSLDLGTAFLVTEHLSKDGIKYRGQGKKVPNADQESTEQEEKVPKEEPKSAKQGEKVPATGGKSAKEDLSGTQGRKDFPSADIKKIYEILYQNPTQKYESLINHLGISKRTVARAVRWLKDNGYINKQHSKKNGEWLLK